MSKTQLDIVAGNYRLHEMIGVGGMGTVFLATDTRTQQTVALKRLKNEMVAYDPEILQRFIREGEALRELNHPNIVTVLDTIAEKGDNYIVMEYTSGGDLGDWIKEKGPLSIRRTVEIGLDLADALTRAHRLNIVHRDIKPSNILIAEDGTPRLTDFGVASLNQRDRMTQTGAVVGTLDYIAPEILNGNTASSRSDIWAFGVVLFEMLTGERPFQGENYGALVMSILKTPTPDLETLCPKAPVGLLDLIYRMLEKDVNARIPSVRLVGAELEAILDGSDSAIHRRTNTFRTIQDGKNTDTMVLDSRFATPTPGTHTKNNLPSDLTPFVGREAELKELAQLVNNPNTRLITILASGGMGKTRLSIEAGKQQLGHFTDGVFFVPLAPLKSAVNMVPTIADAISFTFQGQGNETQELLDYLREKNTLLIMDNFEHVLDGAEIITEILGECPQVTVLASSRENLNVQGETRFRISGMDFPEWETPEDALEYSAVKLFVQSARRARPGFELEADDLTYVARICRLVRGLPLGIVLAAAWVEMLTLTEIAEEITSNLDFLETEARNVPERHRSIRAVFETSWQCLSEKEQQIFAKLAVFRGGFSRKAGQKITGASLRNLTSLVNKSLLFRQSASGRYEVHELLRQYAAEELVHLGLEEELKRAHADYYLRAVGNYATDIIGERQLIAMDDIEVDIENVRSAWDWAFENWNTELLTKSWFPLFRFYQQRNRFQESNEAFAKIGDIDPDTIKSEDRQIWLYLKSRQFNTNTREEFYERNTDLIKLGIEWNLEHTIAFPKFLLGGFMMAQSDFEAADTYLIEALELTRKHDDEYLEAWCSTRRAWLYGLYLGEPEKGIELDEHALAIFKKIGDRFGMSRTYNGLAMHHMRLKNNDKSLYYNQQAYEYSKQVGARFSMANTLNNMGWRAFWLDEIDEAEHLLRESYDIIKDLGGQPFANLNNFGFIEYKRGNYAEARRYFRETIELFNDAKTFAIQPLIPELYAGLALVYYAEGKKERAVEFLAVALPHNAMTGAPEVEEIAIELWETLQKELAKDVFEKAKARGEALDLEEAYEALPRELTQ